MYPKTMVVAPNLRKRPMTQLALRKAKRTAPWAKKLRAIVAATPIGFGAYRALNKKNNVYSYPRGIANLSRRLITAKNKLQNNQNLRKMKIEGFKISRFYLQTINTAAGNATFDTAGFVPALQTIFTEDSTLTGTSTAAYNTPPYVITSFETFTFCPQWPGSTLCSFKRAIQGGQNTIAKFGLLSSNSNIVNNNFKWNSRAVEEVYVYNTSNKISANQNDAVYDHINVYKTYVTIDLMNQTSNRSIEVFIFRMRFKDNKYFDVSDSTCKDIDGLVDKVLNEMCQTDTQVANVNNRVALERMLRAKKLPKGMKVKSCRRVTLGAALTGGFSQPLQGGQIPMKSYKKIKMRFGNRSWIRTGCTNTNQLLADQNLFQNFNKVDHIMIIALPHQGLMQEIQQSSLTETINLGFRISKTNIWKEQSN